MKRILTLLLVTLFMMGSAIADDGKVQPPQLKFEWPNEPKLASFFSGFEKSLRDEFMADYKKAEADGMTGSPWSLDVTGSVDYKGKFWTVSVGGYDYRGGAHGMPLVQAYYFDGKTNEEIKQADLLTEDAYEKLSEWTRRELAKEGFDEDGWMLSGTEPKAENFTAIYPTKESVMVVFPPYQIAPYAAGTPSVELSWEEAASIFLKDYRP